MIFVNRLTKASAKQMQWGINMLSKNLKGILKTVKEYAEDSEKHDIDDSYIEQRLQDIEDLICEVATEFEGGEFENDNPYGEDDEGDRKYHQKVDDEMTGDR